MKTKSIAIIGSTCELGVELSKIYAKNNYDLIPRKQGAHTQVSSPVGSEHTETEGSRCVRVRLR